MTKLEETVFIGNVFPTRTRDNPNQGRVYDPEGICPCLNGTMGGNRQPCVVLKAGKDGSYPEKGIARVMDINEDMYVRRLTPKEYFRLMGFDDKDVDMLAWNGISNSHLYRMAGNSVVVPVMEAIMENLFLNERTRNEEVERENRI